MRYCTGSGPAPAPARITTPRSPHYTRNSEKTHKNTVEGVHQGPPGSTRVHKGEKDKSSTKAAARAFRAMVKAAMRSSKLVAPLQRRRSMLQEKAKTRDHKKMTKKLPAGSAALAKVPKGKDFMSARGAEQAKITEYCKAVRGSTETFKDAHRATSTAMEHDMYMQLINCWAERSGFGTTLYIRRGKRRRAKDQSALREGGSR